jgi:rSAM/selenodomain-associated transferase 1
MWSNKRVSSKGDAILVFSKGSDPANVKTRLHDFVTPEQRFELHLAFLQDTLEKTRHLPYPTYLYVMGSAHFPFQYDLPVYQQEGADLGARLCNAFKYIFERHDRAVVIGTDSPDLPAERIQLALEKLRETDIVLGPTEDGGYYLLGLSQMIPAIFEDISWGSDRVLQQTLERSRNFKVSLLEPHYDVDVIEDLVRLRKNLQLTETVAPHTKEWFARNSFKQDDTPQSDQG